VSDEKPKPFARVLVLGGETFTVGYGSGPHLLHGLPMSELESVARASDLNAEFNTAVEQREAKLRGALQSVQAMVRGAYDQSNGDHPEYDEPLMRTMHLGNTLDVLAAALGPNPPDYVPAEQLRAEQAKVKALQAALDVLDTREEMPAEVVRAYLDANGLRKPEKPDGLIVEGGEFFLIAGGRRLRVEVQSLEQAEGPGRSGDLAITLRGTVYGDERRAAPVLDPRYLVGVATADLAEGQMAELEVTNRTVSPVIVHLQRVAESRISLCPHGHGGEMTIDVTQVTCGDCRALAAGRATPPPVP
jgi:hypothetical protein